MMKEIYQCFGAFIEDMLRSAGKGDKMVFRDANGKYSDRPEYMETPMLVSDLDLRHRLIEVGMEPIRIQALFVEKVRNPGEEYRVKNSIMETVL